MQIDLFYELSVPNFSKISEATRFQQVIDEIRLADVLGYNTAWLVEHHFMPEYSHSSAPELMLAALSQQTDKIRLGQAIIPLPYHHPIHVAERIATLDILSQGRTEIGFGRGFQPAEYDVFGLDITQSRRRTEESFHIIKQALSQSTVSHHSEFFQFSDIPILPRPIQQPPPFWMAAVSPNSFSLAAELNVNVLCGPFKPWFMIKEDIKRFRQHCEDKNQHNQVGMTIGFLCLEDGQRTKSLAKPAFEWFYGEMLKRTKPILCDLYESYEYYHKYRYFQGVLAKLATLSVLEKLGMVIVGNPAECLEKLQKIKAAGVDHIMLAIGAGVLEPQYNEECLHLVQRDIMPKLQT